MSRSTDLSNQSADQTSRAWSLLTNQVEAFLCAWDAGGDPPQLADFVPAGPPSTRRLTLVELIKVDLDYRWRGDKAPKRLEEYFQEFPELSTDPPADLIYEEFHIRKQCGAAVVADDYLARFPQCARELERLLGWQQAEVSTSLVGRRVRKALETFVPGQTIDDFDLLARLGQGAFASVFLARQNTMQRLVALKVSADRGNEPQTLAQLDHEQIVRVYDQRVLPDRGVRLLYMQYVAGGTLQRVVDQVRDVPARERTGRLLFAAVDQALEDRGESRPAESALRERFSETSWPEVVCWLGARLARGLDYAHRHGVLHRDIKPANVLLTAEGAPKLADFNISFSANLAGATPAAYFGGSLAYMSPEQLEACNPSHERTPDSLDGRSDLYSLGVLLWELLTGGRPFVDPEVPGGWSATLTDMTERRRAGVDPRRVAMAERNWPTGLGRVLTRCLQYDPAERFRSGQEFARELELCLQPQAQRLLTPPVSDWRRWTRGYGELCIILAAVLPNILAAVFNYIYNRVEIVAELKGAETFFWRTQAIINSIAFPVGLLLAVGLAWPVTAAVRDARRLPELSAEKLRALRNRCLKLGHFAAAISLALWLVAAPAYPIALHMGVETVEMRIYLHFVASLSLCGLIASAYPFFGVACLSVCSFYPALLRMETQTRDDVRALARLGRASWFYLLLAACVPMLAVAILTLIGSKARFALGTLAVGGLVGFGTAFVLFRTLQADLSALITLVQPPGDSHDSTTESFRSFSR